MSVSTATFSNGCGQPIAFYTCNMPRPGERQNCSFSGSHELAPGSVMQRSYQTFDRSTPIAVRECPTGYGTIRSGYVSEMSCERR